jgi:uncharacterized protein YchJ
MNCDCGGSRSYANCCGRYHAGPLYLQAPNAEALMRSNSKDIVAKARAWQSHQI